MGVLPEGHHSRGTTSPHVFAFGCESALFAKRTDVLIIFRPNAADQVLFDSSLVSSLESTCSLAADSSYRPATTDCVVISNPNRASCREVHT